TSKTYLPCSPRYVLFSETTGRTIVLKASSALIGTLRDSGREVRGQRSRQLSDRRLDDDQPRQAHDVLQVQAVRRDDVNPIQMAGGAKDRVTALAQNDHRAVRGAQARERGKQTFRLGIGERKGVDDGERLLGRAG